MVGEVGVSDLQRARLDLEERLQVGEVIVCDVEWVLRLCEVGQSGD